MSELDVLFWAVLLRGLSVCLAVAGAAYLAYHQREGWGWFIFMAIVLSIYSYKYTKD